MKRILSIIAIATLTFACKNESKMEEKASIAYPETKTVDTVDTYFGTEVKDPYRWLEDDRSEETEAWVREQNKVTYGYLNEIPFRDQLNDRLTEIWNYEKIGAPSFEGNYVYFSKNDGLQNQYVVYRYPKGKTEADAEVYLDPNTFSEDGTTSLAGLSFTKDGSLSAHSISEGGSDWRKIIVMNAETREIIEDTLVDVKFSGVSWKGNEGFYYSSYDKPEGSELSDKTDQHKLYFHTLGTPQSEDEVIFGATPEEKHRYVGGGVTDDQKFLLISGSISTSGNQAFVKDLSNPNADFIKVMNDYKSDVSLLDSDGNEMWIYTNHNAPNGKIVKATYPDLSPENWSEVIPETEHVLSPSTGGGYIFATYMIDAITQVKQYDMDGNLIRDVELPGIGSASGFGAEKDEDELYYSFTNYVTPGSIYKYAIEEGTSELFRASAIDFDSENYESKQVFYTSKDGTKIPMIITHKKGLELNGNNPTILYGYGGFNISLTPRFSTANTVWLEQGGIYAVANLRGGGEYGKEWHLAGTKMQKQNVFDDFIAAGEYLINENYTSSDYLAIRGASNGGLLVGAVMTQRPDLMKVALPAVGVLDMLRYHTFTAGAGWAYDYGTSQDSKEMFEYILGYSPVHNVNAGTEYPATMVTTGDHDDRVVPAHSFKFAAELQDKQSGSNPVLIRIETDAGHGAGKPTAMVILEQVDVFAFTLYNMGFKELPNP